jgi:hypothetical protein
MNEMSQNQQFPASEFSVRAKESREIIEALPEGGKALIPVAVCSTNRIVCDPMSFIVVLPCCKKDGRILVFTVRNPGGLYPGVWAGGMPVIARQDMEPFKPSRPARLRRYGRRW